MARRRVTRSGARGRSRQRGAANVGKVLLPVAAAAGLGYLAWRYLLQPRLTPAPQTQVPIVPPPPNPLPPPNPQPQPIPQDPFRERPEQQQAFARTFFPAVAGWYR